MSSNYLTVQEKVKLLEDNLKKADVLLDKRFLFFAFNCLGKNTEVQLQNGNRAQGTFYTSNFENGGVVLKNYKELNGGESTAQKVLNSKDFVYLLVPEVEDPPIIKPKQKEVFKTDTEISKNRFSGQRNLVKWNQEDFGGETLEQGLEEMASATSRNWNQFEINEKKFGITSEWEEGRYTVEVDFNKVDPKLLEKAKQIEAEILAGTSEYESRHVREERGLIGQAEDEDEEELYSSVIRTEQKPPEKPNLPKFVNLKKNPSKTEEKPASEPKQEVKNEWLKPKDTSHKGNYLDIPQQNPKRDGKADGKTNLQALDLPPAKKIPEDAHQKFNEFKKREEQQEAARMKASQDTSKNEGGEVPKINLQFEESPPNKNKLSLRASSFEVGTNELNSINMSRTSHSTQSTSEIEAKKTVQPTTPQPQMVTLHPTLTTKFKIKLTERDLKKSETSFQDYVVANWEKKTHFYDPEKFNCNWKIQKQAVSSQTSLSQTTTPKSSTSTGTSLQSTSTAFTSSNSDQTRSKAKSFPNQSPQHHTQHQGQHHHHHNQMQQPHNPGFIPQPMMMNMSPYMMYPMQYIPMNMGGNYYQYPKNPQYIDTLHPQFNMSMPYSQTPNPNQRQGSGKLYKKGSSNQGQNQNQQNQNQNQ